MPNSLIFVFMPLWVLLENSPYHSTQNIKGFHAVLEDSIFLWCVYFRNLGMWHGPQLLNDVYGPMMWKMLEEPVDIILYLRCSETSALATTSRGMQLIGHGNSQPRSMHKTLLLMGLEL